MKRILFSAIILLVLIIGGEAKSQVQVSIGFNTFYTTLSPYGEWLESDFGYAWRPMHVMNGWRPYQHGRWAWTHYGWYWVSSEPFGWATFHYGRWFYDDYYGWIWIPDYDWGPSWVEWCYNDSYIGWAPLSPYAHFSINIGITFMNDWATPVHYWNFTNGRHFMSSRMNDYLEPMDHNRRIIGDTRMGGSIRGVDDRIINNGIDVDRIERQTNSRIRQVDVVERDRGQQERIIRDRGQDRIESYKPRVERNAGDNQLRPPVVSQNKRERTTGTVPRVRETDRQQTPDAVLPERNTQQRSDRAIQRSQETTREQKRVETDQRQNIQRQESQQRQEKQRETFQNRQTEQRKQIENKTRQIPQYKRVEPSKKEGQKAATQERTQKPTRQAQPRSGRRP
jgi:hypothetical protein